MISTNYLFSISISSKQENNFKTFKKLVPPPLTINSPGQEKEIKFFFLSTSILSKRERKIDFTPQIVIPGWTAGKVRALLKVITPLVWIENLTCSLMITRVYNMLLMLCFGPDWLDLLPPPLGVCTVPTLQKGKGAGWALAQAELCGDVDHLVFVLNIIPVPTHRSSLTQLNKINNV